MTHKEIQEQLRILAQQPAIDATDRIELDHIANKYDPLRPEPGMVVWWQDTECLSDPALGQFNDLGRIEWFGTTQMVHPDSVRFWPARILGPDEVTVNVPPVSEWPDDSGYCEIAITFARHENYKRVQRVIVRDEARAMEAEHDE